MSEDVKELPVLFEGDGPHTFEYLKARIDVSDTDEIQFSKDHDFITITKND